jgi:signal transduction histidine kinase
VTRRAGSAHLFGSRRASAARAARVHPDGKSRDEALMSIAHDLRSPIAAAELALRAVVARGSRPDEPLPVPPWAGDRLLATAERLQALARLLGELIDVERAHPRRADANPFDLRAVVDDVVRLLASPLQQAGCAVQVSYQGDTTGRWERAPVFQIVANLVTNAMKYGAGRPIRVAASRRAEAVRLQVDDAGIGIAAREHRRIFEKFTRARGPFGPASRGIEGHGLGLWIVARAARRLHAEVEVESTPGQGTRFIVDLPLGRREPAARTAR